MQTYNGKIIMKIIVKDSEISCVEGKKRTFNMLVFVLTTQI